MVRTQIQLTEEHSRKLKSLAAREGISVAELIRRSVDAMLVTTGTLDETEKRRRALAVTGRFNSEVSDLAVEHDRYLTQAYES